MTRQSLSDWSADPLHNMRPCESKAAHVISSSCPSRVAMHSLSATFHSRKVWSYEPVHSRSLRGEKTTHVALRMCPRKISYCPRRTLHWYTVPSSSVDTKCRLDGSMATTVRGSHSTRSSRCSSSTLIALPHQICLRRPFCRAVLSFGQATRLASKLYAYTCFCLKFCVSAVILFCLLWLPRFRRLRLDMKTRGRTVMVTPTSSCSPASSHTCPHRTSPIQKKKLAKNGVNAIFNAAARDGDTVTVR
jgi:hypothetical protein